MDPRRLRRPHLHRPPTPRRTGMASPNGVKQDSMIT
jgi:hypothetical protein